MFPAALAIVVSSFPVAERGRALAIFFGVAGGLHLDRADRRRLPDRVDLAGDLLDQHPGRDRGAGPDRDLEAARRKEPRPARLPGRGAGLGRDGPAVLGLQQASLWGWGSIATLGLHRRRGGAARRLRPLRARSRVPADADPDLRRPRLRGRQRGPLPDARSPFVPLFFFASMYAQISLGESASETGLYLLIFFAGFFVATQRGGRILDAKGARPAMVSGCIVAAGRVRALGARNDRPLGRLAVALHGPRRASASGWS